MEESKIIPLFYNGDISTAISIAEAIYEGGARVLEFTARGDFAHEVFQELVKHCAIKFPELIIGIGSITDGASASHYINIGANFIVTPVFREDVALTCNRRKIPWFPGCGSLTEITKAEELGCEIIKLFPGGIYGPAMISAIKGPQPWTKIMPTGGVSTEKDNLEAWFNAGASCVGMGSKLISKSLVKEKDFDTIRQKTKECLEIARSF